MPKVKVFNNQDYKDSDYRSLLFQALEQKCNKLIFEGASIKSANIRIYDIKISNEDFETFKKSEKANRLLFLNYEKVKKEKIDKYDLLKKKLDYCLFDVKSYKKLIENIDEFTYCGATNELQVFEKRYLKSNGYSKALYRARLQEFSKIDCK